MSQPICIKSKYIHKTIIHVTINQTKGNQSPSQTLLLQISMEKYRLEQEKNSISIEMILQMIFHLSIAFQQHIVMQHYCF
jgi:hypothetical protein